MSDVVQAEDLEDQGSIHTVCQTLCIGSVDLNKRRERGEGLLSAVRIRV